MIKLAMLATVAAGLLMGANVAGNIPQQQKAPLDTKIIVELDRSLESLTDEGIKNVQNQLLSHIRSEVTSNVKLLTRYHVLNNAIAIAVNSQYVDQITNLSGVKSVTENKLHWVTSNYSGEAVRTVDNENDYGGPNNVSAETMQKPDDTNDGEGTLIAILDNGFHLRAKHKEGNEVVDSWNHETFDAFEDIYEEPVIQRFKPAEGNKAPAAYDNTHAHTISKGSAVCGEEGSLYFNSKVPFYFDYGGETDAYASDPNYDLDVSSASGYHGSHVASIAAGNAEHYKGIAPKAQLCLMKVFTNFESSSFTDGLGLGSTTGAYDMPILEALEDCIELGVDGINMSLGSNLDDFDGDSITLKTLTRLAEAGILSAISAGNSGKTSYASLGGYANWTSDMVETGILSSYVNNKATTSVASAQPNRIFYTQALKVADNFIPYEDQVTNREGYGKEYKVEHKLEEIVSDLSTPVNWVFVPGFGTSGDYTDLDVRGKVAVVSRGSTSFADKYTVALNMGAAALIIINNDPTSNDFNFRCSFGDVKPEIPVALVLFKDKGYFDGTILHIKAGQMTLIKDQIYDNDKAKTSSTFTSDGLTYDLELKPDISTPGDNIRGAIPPQKKEDREERPYSTYAFYSGTSMAAPNYAGAQSVVLSKSAKSTFTGTPTTEELAAYYNYRNTVDMRMLSTAEPMKDLEVSPEGGVKTLTSPRIQGAGLVNLGAAYKTDVYLEGTDAEGNGTGKAKLALKNSAAINDGTLNISFYSHNESEENRLYDAYLTVMRPAIKNDNGVVSKEYNYLGEIDDITLWTGQTYWVEDPEVPGQFEPRTVSGDIEDKDYFKVSREFKYHATEEAAAKYYADQEEGTWSCSNCGHRHNTGELCGQCGLDKDNHTDTFETTVAVGKYVYDASTESWDILPGYDYQSTQDVYIEEKLSLGRLTFAPGSEKHTLDPYTLDAAVKAQILDFFQYGCYIEGYVSFESVDNTKPNLNLVYCGFFAGEGQDYGSAPVVEPFNFEKDSKTVYPSDLVNDVTKTLIGKDRVDFGSTWIIGYVEPGTSFDTGDIETNDESLSNLAITSDDYHFIGENPEDNELYDDVEHNLYAGNPYSSNTMIIQQFVLRSVADNNFTITNRETDELVYKSCLIDAIRSYGYMGKWPLYKSHVNDSYLGSYTADKALAVVPLYNTDTGEAFPDGDYDITFNYLLASTGAWVSKTYTFTIDSTAPKVSGISYNAETGKVRIDIEEENLSYATIGSDIEPVLTDSQGSYFEFSDDKHDANSLYRIVNKNMNEVTGVGRLYLSFVDKSFGQMGVVVKFPYNEDFNDLDWNNFSYLLAQHPKLEIKHDIIDHGKYVTVVTVNNTIGKMTEVDDPDIVKFTEFVRDGVVLDRYDYIKVVTKTGGCGGNIATTSVVLSSFALVTVILLVLAKKKKKIGGN